MSAGGRHDLDLAAERAQAGGDERGRAVEPLDVAAARLDRHEILQRGEIAGLLLAHARQQAILSLRARRPRHGQHAGGRQAGEAGYDRLPPGSPHACSTRARVQRTVRFGS